MTKHKAKVRESFIKAKAGFEHLIPAAEMIMNHVVATEAMRELDARPKPRYEPENEKNAGK